MSRKLGIMLRLLLLFLVVDPGGEAVLMEDEEPLSCLEGRFRCLQDATCRVLLETVTKVCGQSSKSLSLSVPPVPDSASVEVYTSDTGSTSGFASLDLFYLPIPAYLSVCLSLAG